MPCPMAQLSATSFFFPPCPPPRSQGVLPFDPQLGSQRGVGVCGCVCVQVRMPLSAWG